MLKRLLTAKSVPMRILKLVGQVRLRAGAHVAGQHALAVPLIGRVRVRRKAP